MVDWNTESLANSLRQVVAHREENKIVAQTEEEMSRLECGLSEREGTVLDEVTNFIQIPSYKQKRKQVDAKDIHLDEEVVEQLRDYVGCLATLYRDNQFHNFEVSYSRIGATLYSRRWSPLTLTVFS